MNKVVVSYMLTQNDYVSHIINTRPPRQTKVVILENNTPKY